MYYGSIYKIVFPNGKHYIGLTTTSLEQRTKEHKSCAKNGDTKCLYNALRKYDIVDTFELIEIDTADTLEELCEKEIGYIIEYNSYYMNGNGYNMTYGGEGANGYVFTDEVKQKMSESRKKYYENPEVRQQMSETIKKYYDENPEVLQKMSETIKKYYDENPEARQQASERVKKYYEENPEAIQKNSEAQKKYHEEHPEAIHQMSERMKTYHEDHPEAGKQHSKKMKQHFEDHPETRQKMSETKKKYFENPEARQKISEIKKKYHKEHPEAGKEHGEIMKTYYVDNPKARQVVSETSTKQWANPEARKKQSEIKKKYNKEHPEIQIKRLDAMGQNKPFDVFKNDGTFIKTFTYQFEAKEHLQKEYEITSNILLGAVLAGRQKSSAGFVFKYK